MGVLLGLLSAVFAASKDLLSKRLAFRLDGTASTFASFFFALPFYVAVLLVLWLADRETLTWSRSFLLLVFLRAVTDTLAEWLKMYALAFGDISLVATFLALSPLFLLVASPWITGDPLSLWEVAAVVLVVLGGLLMVYRPGTADWRRQSRGILLACAAAVFFSLNSCFDRLAVQEGTPVFAGFSMTLLSALFLLPLVLGHPQRMGALVSNWGGLSLRGILEIAFMVCKLAALQYLTAPDVVALQRLSLLLAIVGGRVFFKEADFKRRLAAGALTLAGVLVVGYAQRTSLAQVWEWLLGSAT
jgi:drug/metabolite transporter (DMT)-like permease